MKTWRVAKGDKLKLLGVKGKVLAGGAVDNLTLDVVDYFARQIALGPAAGGSKPERCRRTALPRIRDHHTVLAEAKEDS